MMTDLIAGQIQMAIETSPSANPHVKSGKVKALAVTSAKRSPAYPGVPTVAESGVPGYEVTTWYALMAPRGPEPIRQRMSAELAKVLKQSDVQKRFDDQGVTAGDMTPPQLAAFIKTKPPSGPRWRRIRARRPSNQRYGIGVVISPVPPGV
jgi:tripartite-type tricarboxylate transporter receptor subunit TctC